MSILIKGMEMPKDGDVLTVKKDVDGKIYIKQSRTLGYSAELIELPPHGRLIDADSLKETLDYYIREAGWSDEINEALTWVRDEFIDHEPTIIEAEEVSK